RTRSSSSLELSAHSRFMSSSQASMNPGKACCRFLIAAPPSPIMTQKASQRSFHMHDRIAPYQGITFDDVLLEPGYSEMLPKEVEVRTQATRNMRLNLPILSSPMDTVTESELAIALAQEGGLGILHKNMPVPRQAREVDKVKRSENGII